MEDDKRKSKKPLPPLPQVTTKPLPSPPKKLSHAVQSIKNYKRTSTVKREEKTRIEILSVNTAPASQEGATRVKGILSPRRKKSKKEKDKSRREKFSKAKEFQGFAKSTTEITRVLSAPPEYTAKGAKRNYVRKKFSILDFLFFFFNLSFGFYYSNDFILSFHFFFKF
jgi:hypothetical protein